MTRISTLLLIILFSFMLHQQTSACDGCEMSTEILIDPPTSQPIDKQIKVYPNPAVESIQITHDEGISKVVFYNIIGKEMKSELHTEGQSHSVNDLHKGIYVLRLIDEYNQIAKVVRITVH